MSFGTYIDVLEMQKQTKVEEKEARVLQMRESKQLFDIMFICYHLYPARCQGGTSCDTLIPSSSCHNHNSTTPVFHIKLEYLRNFTNAHRKIKPTKCRTFEHLDHQV